MIKFFQRLEYTNKGSSKYYEVWIDERRTPSGKSNFYVLKRWGRIGSVGQENNHGCFKTMEGAENACKIILRSKIGKGYVIVSDGDYQSKETQPQNKKKKSLRKKLVRSWADDWAI